MPEENGSTALLTFAPRTGQEAPEPPAEADADLLRRIAGGSNEALGTFYDRYSGLVWGLLRRMLGEGGDAVRDAFRVATRPAPGTAPDLFSAVCLKGADTLIADATTPAMRGRLPAWYLKALDAPAFLLLPLVVKGAPVGLIYADKAEAGAIALGEKELSLLRTLRNQAVMAFRQASGG